MSQNGRWLPSSLYVYRGEVESRMTGSRSNASVRLRFMLPAAVLAILTSFILTTGVAQATLSPYPSTGYPQTNAGGSISDIAVSGNTVYVGGTFTTFGGQSRVNLAAFDLSTKAVLPWDPSTDLVGSVATLAVYGSDVFIGGSFTTVAGEGRNRIAKVDGTTGSLDSWNPDANGTVNALELSGPDLYVGGAFSNIGGAGRSKGAKFDAVTGNLDGSWTPVIGGTSVDALEVSGANVYVGGNYTTVGSIVDIGRVDATDGNFDVGWEPSPNGDVNAVAMFGSDVIAGGSFTLIGGKLQSRITKLNEAASATTWDPNANGTVNALKVSGSDVYAGGSFSMVGGEIQNNLVKINSGGNTISWNPNPDYAVFVIQTTGTTVIVGGLFNKLGFGEDRITVNGLAVFKDVQTPVNASVPQISGTANVGQTLGCSQGGWRAEVISSYAYQWARNGLEIGNAATNTYTVGSADVDGQLTCSVTASNFVGSTNAQSDPVAITSGAGSTTTSPPSAMFARPTNYARFRGITKFKGNVDKDATSVRVAIQKVYTSKSKKGSKSKKRCKVLKRNAKKKARFAKRSTCSFAKLKWLKAKITRSGVWSYRLKRKLPSGSYKLYVRAYNAAGESSIDFSSEKKNLVRLKVLRPRAKKKK